MDARGRLQGVEERQRRLGVFGGLGRGAVASQQGFHLRPGLLLLRVSHFPIAGDLLGAFESL